MIDESKAARRDPVALAGLALQRAAESLDATARALRVIGELLEMEAEARTPAGIGGSLTPAEAAKQLRVDTGMIYRAIKRRELIAERYGKRGAIRVAAVGARALPPGAAAALTLPPAPRSHGTGGGSVAATPSEDEGLPTKRRLHVSSERGALG